ncbi:stabilizer of axonemal microtubules 4 [Pelobates fuscus]|uniref:stabilizer of axonemal microtubules 4 n=1 Tax=Pelobates fuscus TaxID=191477 RepID=UPI002FE44515
MSPQIRNSFGGSCDSLNFYCTSYNTSYGSSQFVPGGVPQQNVLIHRNTGYQSNMRPAVYYSPNLDRKDNPSLGLILRNNYTSITNRDYHPHQLPTGTEPLSSTACTGESGYIKSNSVTNPKSRTVKSVYFDTKDHGAGAMAGLIPRHQPLLFANQDKKSPETENLRHGPAFMSTEYKSKFLTRTPREGNPCRTVTGATENSGFTEGLNMEPITFGPPSQYRVPKGFHRLMGQSITKTDFLPSPTMQGLEPLPALARNSNRDSGFSRDTDKVQNISAPFDDSGTGDNKRLKNELLGRMYVGGKELSGFSLNNKEYVMTRNQPPEQYLTNYKHRFIDPTPTMIDREGWICGGIQSQQHSGFSVNNEAHIIGL